MNTHLLQMNSSREVTLPVVMKFIGNYVAASLQTIGPAREISSSSSGVPTAA